MQSFYNIFVLGVLMPILCVVALMNNLAIILVVICSKRFKSATFLSVRLLFVALAIFEILQALYSRGPIALSMPFSADKNITGLISIINC